MRGGNKEEGGAEKAASGGADKANKDDEPSTVPIPEKVRLRTREGDATVLFAARDSLHTACQAT